MCVCVYIYIYIYTYTYTCTNTTPLFRSPAHFDEMNLVLLEETQRVGSKVTIYIWSTAQQNNSVVFVHLYKYICIYQYTVIHNIIQKSIRRQVSAFCKPSSDILFKQPFKDNLRLQVGKINLPCSCKGRYFFPNCSRKFSLNGSCKKTSDDGL
jgi:hypothetical protein